MTTPHIGTSSVYGNQKARTAFTLDQQRQLDAGGNVAGYAVVDGHYTYVGDGVTGQDAYNRVYGTTASTSTSTSTPAGLPGKAWTGGADAMLDVVNPSGPSPQTDPEKDAAAAAKDASNRNALALIKQTLAQYGLPESLGDWAWQEIVAGKGQAEVLLDLRQRPEFKAEFPEIDARLQAGLAPLSPGEIVTYRQQARQMMRAAGMPEGLYDNKSDFTKYLTGDTSLKELGDRISIAAQALYGSPTDLAEARRLGFTDGDAVAMILNPDLAQPEVEKRWAAARLSGTGVRSGYGGLSTSEALDYATLGVTDQQAQQGFEGLQHNQELFTGLDAGEDVIGRSDQLGAALGGNAQAQARIERRAARRKAGFQGGGSFAGGQAGLTGLGGSSS